MTDVWEEFEKAGGKPEDVFTIPPAELSTPRLRELEATLQSILKAFKEVDAHDELEVQVAGAKCILAKGTEEGYKMALEDVEPVLAAARETQANTHEWYCSRDVPCPLCQSLRDALAQFKGE